MRRTAAVLSACDLFLGNNSGPLHYAQAAGCSCVALFSLATPRRFIHEGATVIPVQATALPCIDCMSRRFAEMQTLGCIAAPRGRCVTDVTVETMWRAVQTALVTMQPLLA
jgi:ADP-heptose:LPS heptosyltransferase